MKTRETIILILFLAVIEVTDPAVGRMGGRLLSRV
jgi:hypothetical protein